MFTDEIETTKVGVTDYVEPFSIELEPGTKAVKAGDPAANPRTDRNPKETTGRLDSRRYYCPLASAWASPLVPVMKKDGTVRWAMDLRALNLHRVPDSFPTPN